MKNSEPSIRVGACNRRSQRLSIIDRQKIYLLEDYNEKLGHFSKKNSMLNQKGNYPYSYFKSFKKSGAVWIKHPRRTDVSVTKSESTQTLQHFAVLECGSFDNHH